MEKRSRSDKLSSSDFWEVSHAAARLTEYACAVSARHLRDSWTRMQFNRELAYYAKRVVEDVYEKQLTPQEGLHKLARERANLETENSRILVQTLGTFGGAGQVLAGAGICYGSAGLLCAFAGAPLLAHGANNVYENARGLYEGRGDVQGPVRKVYHRASKVVGFDQREGNMAYLVSDLMLSIGVLFRPVLRADAWRLFNYLRADKEAAVRQMGAGAIIMEGAADSNTGYQLYKEYRE